MLKAKIQKGTNSAIAANGTVMEILSDTIVLINSIHTQFQSADPATAEAFRLGLIKLVDDPDSPVWKPQEGQAGIIFPKPAQEDGNHE